MRIVQNKQINVSSSYHATYINIDNGQIVARMDQPLDITEKEITKLATNNGRQSGFTTAISEIKQQQQFTAVK